MRREKEMKHFAYMTIIGVMSLTSCSTSQNVTGGYPFQSGQTIVLQVPCYFIAWPSWCNDLVPEGSKYWNDCKQYSKGIVPKGTKVKFLGAYAESGFMVDTHIRTYGRILEGQFKWKKVGLDYFMESQSEEANKALPKIEREVFSNK
jgi:hypothetical protein